MMKNKIFQKLIFESKQFLFHNQFSKFDIFRDCRIKSLFLDDSYILFDDVDRKNFGCFLIVNIFLLHNQVSKVHSFRGSMMM